MMFIKNLHCFKCFNCFKCFKRLFQKTKKAAVEERLYIYYNIYIILIYLYINISFTPFFPRN